MTRRLRALHIDGRRFTWLAEITHVPGERECHRGIRLRAWGAGKNSRALQVDLLSASWPNSCATDGAYPTTGHVRTVIAYALSRGWSPDDRGGTWILTEPATDLALPGFLVTDRLHDPLAADPTERVRNQADPLG